ncbi:BMC domain-containing protein [Furfurilactobacillus rossiae]|uniref:BMC domain-containing protein n=1 Tax=Furfurilactobacillus rossiae DSM 15814 TaxID=1114972 RepID=A0A0R1RQA5_9LACO|nr:BMC domain-containing protein [Furfurilactobacillus rossiae]KRL56133.1 hypothetical protein FD35_GL002173 [Furfurilactobacillus rossiae DSM 15814]MCF6166636.1 BMC domain-containing protein [Furfurilactobacillus rossiae]QFR66159.1 BMC domain-containing protein [Furfurilactobacillus rossiae]QLE61590.1 hypothetical protein LROSRS0_1544 [Furfurilactobacillus rossiae]QLE64385.1 hypothetical protein LROSL1_1568 [Furfurilactobacillus rossiae]
MSDALGMVEVGGYSTVIKVADVMVKTANVHIEKVERARGAGQMTVFVTGDVGAVNAAVAAGESMANEVDHFVAKQVIARPAEGLTPLVERSVNVDQIAPETEPDSVAAKPASAKSATPATATSATSAATSQATSQSGAAKKPTSSSRRGPRSAGRKK